jgi:hypothetical protein
VENMPKVEAREPRKWDTTPGKWDATDDYWGIQVFFLRCAFHRSLPGRRCRVHASLTYRV